ncbi:MAG: hypothetical protein ABH831_00730 [Candidatus Nealsonbacteria bacterium]
MKKIFFLTIVLFLVFCFFPLKSQALTISPAKIFLSADPGETITTEMRVRNDLPETANFYPAFERYSTSGGRDEPVFTPEGSGFPTWITASPSKVTLGEKETGNITITIKVPEDAEPGGHSAGIFWSSAPPKGEKLEGGTVGIVTRVGALVLLEVSGDVTESGEVTDFQSVKKINRSRPIGFIYGFKNTGNVHLVPKGEVLIKNFWGKTIEILSANPLGSHILSKTSRDMYAANWEAKAQPEEKISKYDVEDAGFLAGLRKELNGFALGYYRADLFLEYGTQNIQTARASYGFWVLPWRILLVSVIVLAIVLLILTKGIRTYNRWLIAKASGNKSRKRIK